MDKYCKKCSETKPSSEFNKDKSDKNGLTAYCKKCNYERTKKYRKDNKEKIRVWLHKRFLKRRFLVMCILSKSDHPTCARCGCDDIRFIEFNHKNGGGCKEYKIIHSTTKLITNILSGKRKTDDLELLCRPCNAVHFLERKYGPIPMKVVFIATDKTLS